jgi:hypothetical protein
MVGQGKEFIIIKYGGEKMAKKQGKASPVSKKANTAMAKMKGKAKY